MDSARQELLAKENKTTDVEKELVQTLTGLTKAGKIEWHARQDKGFYTEFARYKDHDFEFTNTCPGCLVLEVIGYRQLKESKELSDLWWAVSDYHSGPSRLSDDELLLTVLNDIRK